MLLIDGVKYQEWTPSTEDEFERVVEEHGEDIFGKDAKYFDLRHKLASRSGTGSIPDGYVITLGDKPEVRIIELELASHSLQHIVSQMVNIINGIENPTTQQKICNAIEDGINEDEIFAAKIARAIKPVAIHRFLSDSFSNTLPIINIIIEKSSPVLEEAIRKITPPPRIIEFQTFTREGIGLAVHAHLFEPLYKPKLAKETATPSTEWSEDELRSYLEHCHREHPLTFNYYRFLASYSGKTTRGELINALGKLMGKPITSYSLLGVLAGITATVIKKFGKERLDWRSEDSQQFSISENYRERIKQLTSSLA